jgi:hypothetical protein
MESLLGKKKDDDTTPDEIAELDTRGASVKLRPPGIGGI